MKLGSWRTPVIGNDRRHVITVLEELISHLHSFVAESADAVFLCEASLAFAYYAVATHNEGWLQTSIETLDAAIRTLSTTEEATGFTLYGGIAEIGWVINHLNTHFKFAGSSEPIIEPGGLSEIDSHLMRILATEPWNHTYDLVGGLVGLGVYFLARLPEEPALGALQMIVARLEQCSEKTSKGIAWYTPSTLIPENQREAYPNGYYNLGAAHGIPGVLSLLAELSILNLGGKTTKALLDEGSRWFFAEHEPSLGRSRCGPWRSFAVQAGTLPHLAWCYGDLGVAGVLHRSSRNEAFHKWYAELTDIFDRCSSVLADGYVPPDPMLCHGAMGIAHIFNRQYNRSGSKSAQQASIAMLKAALQTRKPNEGIAGFVSYRPAVTPSLQVDYSLLTGIVGVALALISSVYPVTPLWDSYLLLSAPIPR